MKRKNISLTMQIISLTFFNSLMVLTYIPHTGRVNKFQICIYKDNTGSFVTDQQEIAR